MMMVIMMIRTSPQRHPMSHTPRKVIPRVRINSLELAKSNPDQHSKQMHIPRNPTVDQRRDNRATAQEHSLPGTSILGGQPKGSSVLVVNAMDAAIQGTVVHSAMQPVVVGILDKEPENNLGDHGAESREGDAKVNTENLHHRVKANDHWEFDGKVDQQDVLDAVPLVSGRGHFLVLDFVFEEDAGQGVGDSPGNTAAKVDDFMGEERDDACVVSICLHLYACLCVNIPVAMMVLSQ